MKYLFLVIGLVVGYQLSLTFSRPFQPIVFINGDPDCVILGPQTYSRTKAIEWVEQEESKHDGSSSIVYGDLRYNAEYGMVFTEHKFR